MDLLDNAFRQRRVFLHKLAHIIERFLMTDSFHMIFQRLLVNSQSTENKVRFPKRQRIALNGIGVVCVFNCELLVQSFNLTLCQRSSAVQLSFFAFNLSEDAFLRLEPSVGGLFGVNRDLPAASFLVRAGDLALGA